jgi:hypothetical protein
VRTVIDVSDRKQLTPEDSSPSANEDHLRPAPIPVIVTLISAGLRKDSRLALAGT